MRNDVEQRLRRMRDRKGLPRLLLFLLPAVALQLLLLVAGDRLLPHLSRELSPPQPMRLVIVQPPPQEEEVEPKEEREDPELDGQLVELPEPEEKERPDDADYLAEHDITVPEETRTEEFEVNPEVLSPEWSEEQKMQQEDLVDMQVDKPSTGATVGNDREEPDEKGTRPALPSPWAMTNKPGIQDPVPSAHAEARMSGAPQNDLLNEKLDDRVALNAKEYLYAGYLNRIRRLVNFYWEQNISNLPSSVQMVKSAYITGVEVVLDGTGALEIVEVTHASGSVELDDCVVRAFRMAGPFPNPPEGLVEKDGRVYLPEFDFTVRAGQARMNYQGVDPRSGVQFPGLMKSPY